jgi:hypothetical protein
VVDGIGVYLPLWTAETSIISFAAHVPLFKLKRHFWNFGVKISAAQTDQVY